MSRRIGRSMIGAVLTCLLVLTASGTALASTGTATPQNLPAAAPARCSPGVPPADCTAAADVYNFALSHNFSPPPGLRGGSGYNNGNGLLPAGGDYLEYRLYSSPGSAQRLVIDRANSGANSWFTPDHYASFVQFYLVL